MIGLAAQGRPARWRCSGWAWLGSLPPLATARAASATARPATCPHGQSRPCCTPPRPAMRAKRPPPAPATAAPIRRHRARGRQNRAPKPIPPARRWRPSAALPSSRNRVHRGTHRCRRTADRVAGPAAPAPRHGCAGGCCCAPWPRAATSRPSAVLGAGWRAGRPASRAGHNSNRSPGCRRGAWAAHGAPATTGQSALRPRLMRRDSYPGPSGHDQPPAPNRGPTSTSPSSKPSSAACCVAPKPSPV